MNIDKYGRGKTSVVLIHGGPSIFGYMATLGALLKDEFQILDYAQRGTFENPVPDSEITLDKHISDLKEVVGKCDNAKNVVLVGHSWGAQLALLFASRHPKLVSKIMLIGVGPLDMQLESDFAMNLASRMTEGQRKESGRLEKLFLEAKDRETRNELKQKQFDLIAPLYHYQSQVLPGVTHLKWNYETYKISVDPISRLIREDKMASILGSIFIPVVAFHGEDDPVPWEPTLTFLKEHCKNCLTYSFPKAGHFIWAEPEAESQFIETLKGAIR